MSEINPTDDTEPVKENVEVDKDEKVDTESEVNPTVTQEEPIAHDEKTAETENLEEHTETQAEATSTEVQEEPASIETQKEAAEATEVQEEIITVEAGSAVETHDENVKEMQESSLEEPQENTTKAEQETTETKEDEESKQVQAEQAAGSVEGEPDKGDEQTDSVEVDDEANNQDDEEEKNDEEKPIRETTPEADNQTTEVVSEQHETDLPVVRKSQDELEQTEAEDMKRIDKILNQYGADECGDKKSPDVKPGPAPPTAVNLEATATVKLLMVPNGLVTTLALRLKTTIAELKDHFAKELKIPIQVILLVFDGRMLDDAMTLAGLGVSANGTVQLEMQSSDPVNTPIPAFKNQRSYHMPDIISVRVETEGSGQFREVVVEIERQFKHKKYLGGYRHKKTGVEFHHASAQTIQKPRPDNGIEKYCRDTQTTQARNERQQVSIDTHTQMTGIGVYVANVSDKLVAPKAYQTADELHAIKVRHVIVLQKHWRRWLATRFVESVRREKQKLIEFEKQEEIRKRKKKEQRKQREWERRMDPKTKEDFDMLYGALEKWRLEQEECINATLTGAERKAALCALLDQETDLILSIQRHKADAGERNKKVSIEQLLAKSAAPTAWKGPDGKKTEMDTPYTIRARELKDIYNSLNIAYLTQDERLDVLLTLKHTVKEHDCKLTRDIIELIDREADLMMRGMKETNMVGLRQRIATLFLQYIKTPTFNPEISRLLKVPSDPSELRRDIYFCGSCTTYLPSIKFDLPTNARAPGKCRKCVNIDNEGRRRQDFAVYKHLLVELQKSEAARNDGSRIAFYINEEDMRYLIEKIWGATSIISGWTDLYDLVLIRWDHYKEWSPWNCCLLTKDEAAAHQKLDLNFKQDAYADSFLQRVHSRHVLGRNYFSKLHAMCRTLADPSVPAGGPNAPVVRGHSVGVQVKRNINVI